MARTPPVEGVKSDVYTDVNGPNQRAKADAAALEGTGHVQSMIAKLDPNYVAPDAAMEKNADTVIETRKDGIQSELEALSKSGAFKEAMSKLQSAGVQEVSSEIADGPAPAAAGKAPEGQGRGA